MELLKKRAFIARSFSAERNIAMWKTTESIDNFLMTQRETVTVGISQRSEIYHRFRLIILAFAMLKRHIKKLPLIGCQTMVETARHGLTVRLKGA